MSCNRRYAILCVLAPPILGFLIGSHFPSMPRIITTGYIFPTFFSSSHKEKEQLEIKLKRFFVCLFCLSDSLESHFFLLLSLMLFWCCSWTLQNIENNFHAIYNTLRYIGLHVWYIRTRYQCNRKKVFCEYREMNTNKNIGKRHATHTAHIEHTTQHRHFMHYNTNDICAERSRAPEIESTKMLKPFYE